MFKNGPNGWFYDSKPGCASIETEVKPLQNYFPYFLWQSYKFQDYSNQVKNPLRIRYPDPLTVPRLMKSGDCGVYMLKTLEMLLAGMWNTAARKFLNDDAIEDVRQTYATQIYVNSAEP
ncbi:hypothetical protein TIFTF001_006152 [Ficus carica]|uniref:Ubiquitin-like protease family profile domain-containing protein n=1 Tax=Ficus carica TaxID=3494 RepID=A0AA88CZF9_FICCA|nr:hypothetical protein TIFTF001_006152 [Ficus carica]